MAMSGERNLRVGRCVEFGLGGHEAHDTRLWRVRWPDVVVGPAL